MAALALRWASYVALGLAVGAMIWAVASTQHDIVPKLIVGLALTLAWVLGMALRRKLAHG